MIDRAPLPRLAPVIVAALLLSACATEPLPQIDYDASVPPLPPPPAVVVESGPEPLHRPPVVTPARGGTEGAATPTARIAAANGAARIEPRRAGYFNAVQVYHYSPGALYRIYASPGKITEIALDYGERLVGDGPIAAGDTARWIIGDTVSGAGRSARVHVLVKPTRPDIETNLILNTDRRTYHLELISDEATHMPSVAWYYPAERTRRGSTAGIPAAPILPAPSHRNHRYALQVEAPAPPWRPRQVYDDGRRVYIEFPRGIVQGEMPPLFVLGSDGSPELVNSRVHRNVIIVDRLFAAAELRLGTGRAQQVVRIVRRQQSAVAPAPLTQDRRIGGKL
ncbi:P-type conjugative transfer protein TrbG [Jannaschia sp. S6380]|uniref:P-type conjugative transfer protein TrbG n=1 Tax=Jannaschia sp. S6380 TaxID=2926408 RepID=UPI001FF34F01|nr:P-type conjugative transfer protein TrbG [Jannaschia sp. S6380]MCK0166212.1 P-type conjugative transfer protein TrbG [Jannaschia sp. S6380]